MHGFDARCGQRLILQDCVNDAVCRRCAQTVCERDRRVDGARSRSLERLGSAGDSSPDCCQDQNDILAHHFLTVLQRLQSVRHGVEPCSARIWCFPRRRSVFGAVQRGTVGRRRELLLERSAAMTRPVGAWRREAGSAGQRAGLWRSASVAQTERRASPSTATRECFRL